MSHLEAGSTEMTGNPAQGAESAAAGNNGGMAQSGAAQAPVNDVFSTLDADTRTFAENKGWHRDQNPVGAVLKSYRELETKLGSAVTLPAEGDAEGLRKLYGKLGMPDKSDAYALNAPANFDPTLDSQVRDLFHTAGLTQAQATAVYDGYSKMVEPYVKALEADHAEAAATVKELGEARMAAARGAYARFMGDKPEDAEAMEKTMGSRRMLRFFANLAEVIGEDGKGALGIGSVSATGKGSGPDGTFTHSDLIREMFEKTAKP